MTSQKIWGFQAVTQTHCMSNIHLDLSKWPHGTWRSMRTNENMKLRLLVCWSSKVFCLWTNSLIISPNIHETIAGSHVSLCVEQHLRHFLFLDIILPSKSIIPFMRIFQSAQHHFYFPTISSSPTQSYWVSQG